jgi:hypothetical protein
VAKHKSVIKSAKGPIGLTRSVSRARQRPAPVERTAGASKISVTVDAEVLQEVKRVIRGTGQSLSAHITEALERDLRLRRLQQLIEEYEAGAGTISEHELAEIRAEWQA